MQRQLPFDCLNIILEHLEDDKITLHSCLLANRLWCEISVRILWRDIWKFQHNVSLSPHPHRTRVLLGIVSTLVACLPSESKELLNKNEIHIPTPTSKPPLFNYASFIKVLSISKLNEMIFHALGNQKVNSLSLNYNKRLIEQELIKMFMNQISCLKKLSSYNRYDVSLTYLPGAIDCLTNLSELCCNSDVDSHFFYYLSQICRNMKSLTIEFQSTISNGLANFISAQKNLKHLNLSSYRGIPPLVLENLFKNLRKGDTIMTFLTNLKELTLHRLKIPPEGLQDMIFSNLQTLKFHSQMKDERLLRFIENNGNHLKELNVNGIDFLLGSSIAKFCPNLQKISSILMDNDDGLKTLKIIFNHCQYLESIEIRHNGSPSNEKETLEIIAKHSRKNFCELKIHHETLSKLLPEDLESFLISWKDRVPKNSLTLVSIKGYFWRRPIFPASRLSRKPENVDHNEEVMKIIREYKKLGIIKNFVTRFESDAKLISYVY